MVAVAGFPEHTTIYKLVDLAGKMEFIWGLVQERNNATMIVTRSEHVSIQEGNDATS